MGETIAFDRVFDALSHRYRRRLLLALLEHNPQQIEKRGEDVGGNGSGTLTISEPKADALVAMHNHLPRLDTYGYISWDQETGAVTTGEQWDEIAPTLQVLVEHGDQIGANWAPSGV